MRNPKRIDEILGTLSKIWKSNPDMRFGQLLINLGIAQDTARTWNIEDDELETYIESKKGRLI
jgi:uncharacterized protein YihD (DUF1040 family)